MLELRRRGATLLEEGTLKGPIARLLGRAWARRSQKVARPLDVPAGIATIGVGGATLGGSYRTPTAIAIAKRLASRAPVARVSHGYGASLQAPRIVLPTDHADDVGDEAVLAARLLAGAAIVVSGPSRQASLELAVASGARLVVFDALLQTRPTPVGFSILALDAERPWGSGAVPPEGDLRAEPAVLRASADALVTIAHDGSVPGEVVPCAHRGAMRITGAREILTGRVVPLSHFDTSRVGLSTSIARPDRVRRALEAHGIVPQMIVAAADHGPPSLPRAPVDAWLVTDKCATWLRPDAKRPECRSHLVGVFALETEMSAPSLTAFAEAAVLDRPMAGS
ncbi:MAG: tetraacyldisaccharide 4'-kinase [Polyangiaceae bacterium]